MGCDTMNFFANFEYRDGLVVEGLNKELSTIFVCNYFKCFKKNVIVVTSNIYEANLIYQSLLTYTHDVIFYPMDDFLTSLALSVSPEFKLKRLEAIEEFGVRPHIVVTNIMGYIRKLPAINEKDNNKVLLEKGMKILRDDLINSLDKLGYKRDSIVTSTGEYAVRGFVVDVFLTNQEHPIRVEFFDDEIDSIRFFDENTQRTISDISAIVCLPIAEIIGDDGSSLYDYLGDASLFLYHSNQIKLAYQKLEEEILSLDDEDKNKFYSMDELKANLTISLNLFDNIDDNSDYLFKCQDIDNFNGNFDLLKERVNKWCDTGYSVIFVLSKQKQIDMIRELFNGNVILQSDDFKTGNVYIIDGKINNGFVFNKEVYISEYDIENTKRAVNYKNNFHIGTKIKNLDHLQIGDYVVHRVHGIGVYNGVTTLKVQGMLKDFIQISYLGNDKVYIPVEKISSIYKYSDKDGTKPQINKLGSTSWVKKKQAVQKRIHDIPGELIELYAKRESIKGEAYVDYPLESIFSEQFSFEETKDQKRAIRDVLTDLNKETPMDRLLCGDVGFGKTEVAFRAIFKTVCNNKQVMYLCPTTILSKQQYESCLERFKDFPVSIALLNRFTSSKEAKEIVENFKNGKIDILFGTHRLLSDDIMPLKLGLLIVDEEQRFGVTHKEKIKRFKNDVNVLTLSATPIPRTLKMAMSGLRDLSIIDTPPMNRYPVQTYVVQESDNIVRDAVYKELGRDGQVFILYNFIESIEDVADKLKRLIPEARIRYAHGQMKKEEIEDIMNGFIEHEFDVLLSTTIIETGIDIPNANTLIIYNADRFGLSQLYQLRGRVGRSNKVAYAYLMYDKSKMLNDIAVKRLQAIRDFTELGSGYKIAMRDLSIRGAGDLLGSEQAGFVDSVGISLYTKMVEEEMKKLKGEDVPLDENNESLIHVTTHIDDSYIPDEEVKIEIHKLINEIDSYQKLEDVKNEIVDRFGPVSDDLEVYMYEEWFEKIALELHITEVVQNDRSITVSLPVDVSSKIKGDKLFMEAYSINPKFQIHYIGKKIQISLNFINVKKHFIYDIVKLFSKINEDMKE